MRCRMLALVLAALLLLLGVAAAETAYELEVDLVNQIVTAYVKDGGEIARQMICSAGTGGEDATPTGSWRMKGLKKGERGEWYYIEKYKCYVRYPSRIHGAYLFHSLPYAAPDLSTIDQEARSQLGEPASHGCVRLRSEDAQWIAENCPDGTRVRIFDDGERDDALRERLLCRSYEAENWPDYAAYLAADLTSGLTGALEGKLREPAAP